MARAKVKASKAARVEHAATMLRAGMSYTQMLRKLEHQYNISTTTAKTDLAAARKQPDAQAATPPPSWDPLNPGATRWTEITYFLERSNFLRRQADLCYATAAKRLDGLKCEKLSMSYRLAAGRAMGMQHRLPEDELNDLDVQRSLVNVLRSSVHAWDTRNLRDLYEILRDKVAALEVEDYQPTPESEEESGAGYL